MALLTADDVLNKKFQATKFREGYDQDEVDDFLDEVVNTLRDLQGENEDLKTKLAAAERRIAELSRAGAQQSVAAPVAPPKPEPAPEPAPVVAAPAPVPAAVSAGPVRTSEPESATGMLQLAQKLHDDYVRSGQEESERLVGEAKSQANRIVREAEETSQRTLGQLEQERSLLERKIDELRVFERDYRTRLKSYLENLLGDLDNRGNALPPRSSAAQPVGEGHNL
ncbi:MAG: DivIVA domain-containing protein [Cellulomonas sp.]|uniref:Cell wall synthesis protein Wag31 n=1 Tax=Cellulomonas gelida TaxID=1712 RepID=A0A4Y3KIY7_9CELL|nr:MULTISPECIES: DivIVA domain-containing protein [Cellulomonas]KMM45816.1 cell division protein DivIVA [Cellulomonas sp. A375-1]MCR6647146.1 DivIVA domain-containing protein [Cellulomonas sp.]MCR6706003.1 DivIVA domain-containing protein [Cellulomonas sp.]GEA83952.1 cell division protein DivIVA [Cellulomonas gelida]GGL27444.1 cell division protein DivIVA [Cellulomonas gelida]